MAKRTKTTVGPARITRAHLDMLTHFSDDEGRRYAIDCLSIRRDGDHAVVEATDGGQAWQLDAEFVPLDDMPKMTGRGLEDGERVLVDPETVATVCKVLPKAKSVADVVKSAYLTVDDDHATLHVLRQKGGVSVSSSHTSSAEGSFPDVDSMMDVISEVEVLINPHILADIGAWASKHTDADGSTPVKISLSANGSGIRIETNGARGMVARLMYMKDNKRDVIMDDPPHRRRLAAIEAAKAVLT